MRAVFVDRDDSYLDFHPEIEHRGQLKAIVETDPGVQAKEQAAVDAFNAWWDEHQHNIDTLPEHRNLYQLRHELLSSFEDALTPVGLLDRFKVSGVVVSWWQENQLDMRVLRARGFAGVIDSWIASFRAEVEDEDGKIKLKKINLQEHRLVSRVLPEYLNQLAEAEDRIADLEEQQAAWERGEGFDEDEISNFIDLEPDEEEEDEINVAKALDEVRLELGRRLREDDMKAAKKRIRKLESSDRTEGSIAYAETHGEDADALRTELQVMTAKYDPRKTSLRGC